jgi:hypothetical protein
VAALETLLAFLLAVPPASGAREPASPAVPACAVAGRPIRLGLCPAGDVGASRLLFRGASSPHWYFVDATREGPCLWGSIPSPQRRLGRVTYAFETTGTHGQADRTPDRVLRIVSSADACSGGVVAPAALTEPAFVGATAGAPLSPEGFGPAGGHALPLIVAGAVLGGAGGTVAALSAGGGGAAAPPAPRLPDSPPATPAPTLAPTSVPTALPTLVPTEAPRPPRNPPPPTEAPTPEPTAPPSTPAPTPIPTAPPTPLPTSVPTIFPLPTLPPSTPVPTAAPTLPPTATPTIVPTILPTATPTAAPTSTVTPTPRSTATPTATPTTAPRPTATPTTAPTARPTTPPTASPTTAPTATPRPSAAPTATPTTAPTATPRPAATATPRPSPSGSSSDSGSAAAVTWRSLLDGAGAHVRLIGNGALLAETTEGTADGRFAAGTGDNRLELEVVAARGPGRWTIALGGQGFAPGSLRVLAGDVTGVSNDSVAARLTGRAGEKLVLLFRGGP